MSDARTEVLDRIRSALGPDPQVPEVSRGYRTSGEHGPGAPELLDLLTDRLVDYKAGVTRCTADELPGAIAEVLSRTAPGGRLVVPPGLPEAWTAGADVLRDSTGQLSTDELDTVAGVVTACAVAVAETGTIVLDAGDDQGRRALRSCPTCTCAWCAPTRSCRPSPKPSAVSRRPAR